MKAKRTKGINTPSATLRCQRKNKRHVKFCDEWLEREERRQMLEQPIGNFKIIRRMEDLPRFSP